MLRKISDGPPKHISAIIASRSFLVHIRVARGRTFRSIIDTKTEGEEGCRLLVSMQHGGDEIRRYLDVDTYRPVGNSQQRGE